MRVIQSATELTHLFAVRAPRGRGVSRSLETGRHRPASGNIPGRHSVSSHTSNCIRGEAQNVSCDQLGFRTCFRHSGAKGRKRSQRLCADAHLLDGTNRCSGHVCVVKSNQDPLKDDLKGGAAEAILSVKFTAESKYCPESKPVRQSSRLCGATPAFPEDLPAHAFYSSKHRFRAPGSE